MIHAKPVAVARVSLPIRRPRREVFQAFTDPDLLAEFWPDCAGETPLEPGAVCYWRMYETGAQLRVECDELVPDCLIRLSLSNGTRIMLTLDRFEEGGTVVHFCQCGFGATPDPEEVAEATRAAANMLSDLKGLLERGSVTGGASDSLRLPTAA